VAQQITQPIIGHVKHPPQLAAAAPLAQAVIQAVGPRAWQRLAHGAEPAQFRLEGGHRGHRARDGLVVVGQQRHFGCCDALLDEFGPEGDALRTDAALQVTKLPE